jgi:hypothetical protein
MGEGKMSFKALEGAIILAVLVLMLFSLLGGYYGV